MTLVQNLKARLKTGGRQQHTLGSGTQEIPADMPGDNTLVGQGPPKTSLGKNTLFKEGHVSNNTSMASVQQGKQKVPQKGEPSTTEPSAGSVDSTIIPSKIASHVGCNMNDIKRI